MKSYAPRSNPHYKRQGFTLLLTFKTGEIVRAFWPAGSILEWPRHGSVALEFNARKGSRERRMVALADLAIVAVEGSGVVQNPKRRRL
jgi:hypothetical protein